MEIRIFERNGQTFGELVSDDLQLKEAQDILDIMATASYDGCQNLIIHEKNFDPDFFDLKTRIAGEILQKFSNYRMRLAIVGSFDKYESQSLRDFIVECNRGRTVFFVDDIDAAVKKLSQA
ncbi:DUF4180 domain-containing protein [Oligoflexus tunisiensis]|uniref:DUF4180 domain-containing protein n=1 Tax=Oligoflexus tunisiensis TaxID=708132 RepID=UPI000ADFA17C|nr:DUF4180 domain-containing protein [Oligoflexus tunisiensis]